MYLAQNLPIFALFLLLAYYPLSSISWSLSDLLNVKNVALTTKKLIRATPIIAQSVLPLHSYRAPASKTASIERVLQPTTQRNPRQQRVAPVPAVVGGHFVRDAVRSVGPSVVRIDCEREISQFTALFSENSLKEGDVIKVSGTGFVMTSDGYILTNAHVIDSAKKVTITLSNGRTFKAKVVSSDEFTDLAVIKVDVEKETNCQLCVAPLGDSSSLQAGDWVIAVGCPMGLDFTVTLGVVSSPKRSALEVGAPHLKGNYIQTDAALNSGNSGGPLVNHIGQVIGINTMVRTNTEAIGFAIPINRATEIYEVLKHGRKPTHAFFGLSVTPITPDNARIHNDDPNAQRLPELYGALVRNVVPGSPADFCGIRKNDIIIEVNGEIIRNSDDAESIMDQCMPGKPSKLVIARGEVGKRVGVEAVPNDLLTMLELRRSRQGPLVVLKPSMGGGR